MSLATRCTSCGTVFRVVQDQLKVSEGWVRCGRCNEVFNALEGLFDLEREAPPPWPVAGGVEAFDEGDLPEAVAADASDPALVDRIDAALFSPRNEAITGNSGHTSKEPRPAEPPPAAPQDAASLMAGWDVERPGPPVPTAVPAEPAAPPEFVRHAERAARWQSRSARIGLSMVGIVFVLMLAVQVVYHYRDLVAARWPAVRPVLAGACAPISCSIEALRRIEDISVETTALTRADGPDAFRLSVTLRNRGGLPLAVPSVDLSLTDNGGQLLARRALAPRDFRIVQTVLQPGAETMMQLLLSAGTPRVTGYTVEVFYP